MMFLVSLLLLCSPVSLVSGENYGTPTATTTSMSSSRLTAAGLGLTPGPASHVPLLRITPPRARRQTIPIQKLPRCINVYFEGYNDSFCLDRARVLRILGADMLTTLWHEANITEELFHSLNQAAVLYHGEYRPVEVEDVETALYSCPLKPKEPLLEERQLLLREPVSGYLGNFGIPAGRVHAQLMYHGTTVTRHDFPVEGVFYSSRSRVFYSSANFLEGTFQVTTIVTPFYMFVQLSRTETSGAGHTYAMFFGENNKFPIIKGAKDISQTLMVKGNTFSLGLVTTFLDHAHVAQYLDPDYVEVYRLITQTRPDELIGQTIDEIVRLEVTGQCPVPHLDTNLFMLMFKAAAAHFMVQRSLMRGLTDFACMTHNLATLQQLRGMISSCFHSVYTKGFDSRLVAGLAATQVANLQAPKFPSFSTTEANVVFDMLRVSMGFKSSDTGIVEARVMEALCGYILNIYTPYTSNFTLTTEQRTGVEKIYAIMNQQERTRMDAADGNRLQIYAIATSMCTAPEVARLVMILGGAETNYTFDSLFSPCYFSLRFDFSIEKILREAPQRADVSLTETMMGTRGFFNELMVSHLSAVSVLPIAKCVSSNEKVLLAMPLENITYVVTPVLLQVGKTYEVSQVFLKNSMFITAVNNDCSASTESGPLPITVIPRISGQSNYCSLCGSVVLNYDELDGVQSAMLVTNRRVQEHLLSPGSPLFATQNMHTHYLLLLSNGTVLEFESVYRDRASSVLIIILFFMSFALGVIVLYKLISYFK